MIPTLIFIFIPLKVMGGWAGKEKKETGFYFLIYQKQREHGSV